MLKLMRYFFVVLFITAGLVLAQSSVVKKDLHKQIIDSKTETSVGVLESSNQRVFQVNNPVTGDPIGISSYDYFTNSVMRKQILYNNGIHMSPMLRGHIPNPNRRVVTYIYKDGTNYVQVPAFDTSANSGWGHIDMSLTGDYLGTIGIVGHTPNRLALWDPSSSTFTTSQFEAYTDPSLSFVGNNIFLATSGNRIEFQFFKTEDAGVTFNNWGKISDYHPGQIYWATNGGVEVGMAKSANEQHLIMFGTNANMGHVYDGIGRDSADNVWIIKSSDAGATFTTQVIGWDGDMDLLPEYTVTERVDTLTYTAGGTQYVAPVNKDVAFTFTPLFENFGHIDMVVTNSGVIHAIANGYGLAVTNLVVDRPGAPGVQDTVLISATNAIFPVIYWNSSSKKWVAISDKAIDTIADTILADKRPGNGIGQSYPSLSIDADGNTVYAIWTGPEMAGGNVTIDPVTGKMMTDLYHAYSLDGGTTWAYGGTVVNTVNKGDIYGHGGQFLQVEGKSTYTAHIIYLEDLQAGASVFGGADGTPTLNNVVYKTFSFQATDVKDNDAVVTSYQLSQNYPNPFNPTTQIQYTIPERGNVSIKVYDVLGNEVATLFNGMQESGSHSVNFDASKLSSGMYLYTINAGSFTASKKMMLMK